MAYISEMSVNIIMGSAACPYKCAISTYMHTYIRIGSLYEHWILAYSQHTMHMAADKHLWESFSHIIRMDGEGGETERRSGEGGEAVGAAHLYRQLERRETEQDGDEDRGTSSDGRIDIGMGRGEGDAEEDR